LPSLYHDIVTIGELVRDAGGSAWSGGKFALDCFSGALGVEWPWNGCAEDSKSAFGYEYDGVPGATILVIEEGGALMEGMKMTRADGEGAFEVTVDRPGSFLFTIGRESFGGGQVREW